ALLEELAQTVEDASLDYAHQLRIPVPVKTRTVAPTGTIAKLAGVSEGIHPISGKYFLRRIRFANVNPDEMATVEEYRRQGYGVVPDLYAPNTTVRCLPTMDSLLAPAQQPAGDVAAGSSLTCPPPPPPWFPSRPRTRSLLRSRSCTGTGLTRSFRTPRSSR